MDTPKLAIGGGSFALKTRRWDKTELSDGCGRLAFRACKESSTRPIGRYWRAGRVAVYLPGSSRNHLADHDGNHALQGLATVTGAAVHPA